jgi:hypothetical protein
VIIGTRFDFPHVGRDETSPHGSVIFDEFSSDVQRDLFALVLAYRRTFPHVEQAEIDIANSGQDLEPRERPVKRILYGIMVRRSNQFLDSYERVGYFRTRELRWNGALTILKGRRLIAKIKLF